jgi:ribosome recycling factor
MKIIEGDIDSFIKQSNTDMEKALKFFEKDLLSLRTGKASTALVESILVEVHGQTQKLRELASLSVPDARMIVISPWDKSIIANISKAISASDLGLNPTLDSDVLRLQLPMMSSERREEIVKQLAKKLEDAKVAIRNVRKDFHNGIKSSEKSRDISEDFAKKLADKLQKSTDAWIDKVSAVAKKKESELRAV